jgi:hypothetical protein
LIPDTREPIGCGQPAAGHAKVSGRGLASKRSRP